MSDNSELEPVDEVNEVNEYFNNCVTVTTGEFEKSDVVYAISATGGFYNKIAYLLSKTRAQVKKYIETNKDLQLLVEDMREGLIDDAESRVMHSAANGDPANGRFVLSTVGKDRGFTTKSEVEGSIKVDPSITAMLERVAERGGKLVG